LRKVLTAAALLGATLLSCAPQQQTELRPATPGPMLYEPAASVARAPLSPPSGYTSPPDLASPPGLAFPPGLASAPPPLAPYQNSVDGGEMQWRASPRWSAVEGDGCVVVDQEPETAGRFSVKNCPEEDRRTSPD
jgi:hypothetical protein